MGERVGELRGDCRANLPHALLVLPRERVAWTELEALNSDSGLFSYTLYFYFGA
jgi:hypothetical protein